MFERPQAGERALLVHLKFRDPRKTADFNEFRELAVSAGAEVVGMIFSSREFLDAKYLIGTGKLEELKQAVEENEADLVLFNHPLAPGQVRNLEKALSCRVVDRTGLILDIFAQRARTFEGQLQVELAQLQHLSTQLVRGWTHLERQKGGIGLRGPGETQLEIDKRLIRDRVKHLTQKLEKVRTQRAQSRHARQRNMTPTVSLVGYTNAGKSTLFNKLTNSEVYTANQLFATLDPTLRRISLRHIGTVILADTVGFIRDLPHQLIDAFRATLEETQDSDLLLHVIDVGDDLWREQKQQVEVVLGEIGALNVPRLEVYNKIDLLDGMEASCNRDPQGVIDKVWVSAKTGRGLDLLGESISERLCKDVIRQTLCLPPREAKLRAQLYQYGAVDAESSDENGNWIVQITLQQQRWLSFLHAHPALNQYIVHQTALERNQTDDGF